MTHYYLNHYPQLSLETIESFKKVRECIQAAVAAQTSHVTLAEAQEQVKRFKKSAEK